ncbi:YIF1-domain-containing protein [Tilletiaria anomala UBC 951]|uniref:YIF1-domain-containing protein n=1 Tax=Tilletiaria anomala (strain ATCC 24038 / CBS 436.72 / UBC 951) TaxID=1037660 RepID=A0A066WF20_TILAU|nr:YIF1-domain-containing protein [Tilletiaria anomala UBC 951]KDN52567.1 YIF1-domain-containing protein [Tilletiaria anomala UBC 951]
MSQYSSRSPPPLRHPVPTHPPLKVPDPPITPTPSNGAPLSTSPTDPHTSSARPRAHGSTDNALGGDGYVRYSSPPINQANPYGGPGTAAASSFGGSMQQGMFYQGGDGRGAAPSGSMQVGGGVSGAGPYGGWVGAGGPMGGIMNDATAQMGMQFGAQIAAAGGDYVEKNINRFFSLPALKYSFNVSNSYVLHKLRLVLFPWRHKPWSRSHRHGNGSASTASAYAGMDGHAQSPGPAAGKNGGEGYLPPREDVNSPDLYIPSMAFVTYILVIATIHGLESRFHPEQLGLTSSRALAIILLEVSFVKLGCYLLNIQGDHTVVDLVAYAGYKFVGTLVTLLVGLLGFEGMVYWGVFLYTFSANAFFILRSLRYVVLPDPSSPSSVTITHAQRSKRIQFLFAIAVAQLPLCWALVVGIFNGSHKAVAAKAAAKVAGAI